MPWVSTFCINLLHRESLCELSGDVTISKVKVCIYADGVVAACAF